MTIMLERSFSTAMSSVTTWVGGDEAMSSDSGGDGSLTTAGACVADSGSEEVQPVTNTAAPSADRLNN